MFYYLFQHIRHSLFHWQCSRQEFFKFFSDKFQKIKQKLKEAENFEKINGYYYSIVYDIYLQVISVHIFIFTVIRNSFVTNLVTNGLQKNNLIFCPNLHTRFRRSFFVFQ